MDVHLQKLRARFELSEAEERCIRGLVDQTASYRANQTAIRTGQPLTHSTVLLEGIMARHKDLKSGVRQITELQVPGDFTDLHGFTLKRLDHDVVAMTDCRVALIPHERLKQLTEEQPRLTRIYWFGTNLDAAIHREWELSLGRRQGVARMAHLFCEINVRLALVGLSEGNSYDFPLSQAELGECLGQTAVHVNRTLQQLRDTGAVEFKNGRVEIFDFDGLAALAGFDPYYLYLGQQPL